MNYTNEKLITKKNGIGILIALIIITCLTCVSYKLAENPEYGTAVAIVASVLLTVECILFAGFKTVKPNEAVVLSLFGKYYGTIYEDGFYFVNPFAVSVCSNSKGKTQKVSTKIATFVNNAQKVNDKLGNPIEVGAIVTWKVVNATQAVLNIDNYRDFISNQTDATIRNVARLYPYDLVADTDENNSDANELTLRGSASVIANMMKQQLQEKVNEAGIEIIDVKLNQLAYATEIASAMLQRQQAIAVIAARKKIVEGAVSMVEMALDKLKDDGVVNLDEERKAQMVSNLLVVLCSSKEANPVLNTSSIY